MHTSWAVVRIQNISGPNETFHMQYMLNVVLNNCVSVGDGVSVENLATPLHISPPINATLPTEIEASLKEIEPEMMESLKALPLTLRSSIKSNSTNPRSAFTPVPTTTTFAPTAEPFKSGNRFSQDIYDDIADSALDSYSMSHNDIYSMQTDIDVPSAGVEVHVDSDRAPYINGLGYYSKAGKKDESKPLHYTNTALISISERAAPTLVPKKTAASLPSLIDPKFYHESVSLQRRPNEAPGAVRGAQNKDLYDTLAKKKPDPTYYNQAQVSGSRAALLVEDDEPDYDEVDEEDETTSKPRGRGNGVSGSKHAALNSKSAAHNKHMTVGKQNSVASESYEDMSGLEEFIDSYKSSTAGSVL